jgi:hypothetical protein
LCIDEVIVRSAESLVIIALIGKEGGIGCFFLKLIDIFIRVIDFSIFFAKKVEIHIFSWFVEDLHVFSDDVLN